MINRQQAIDYERIAAAISYIQNNFKAPPYLKELAKKIQLLKNKMEKLKEQRNGLMQVLLTGKKNRCNPCGFTQ